MHHDTSFSGRFRAMRVLSTLPGRRSRRARIAAAAVIAVALGATTAPVDAHDGDHDHAATTSTTDCPPATAKSLAKAGDNFAQGCLPGEDIARLDDSEAALAPGEQASSRNVELLANIPKQGAFDAESALNSDLAFKGDYAFAGNYNGFMVYDISKPKKPRVVTQVVCPGSQNDVSVYGDLLVLSVDSSRNDDSCASTSQPATEKSSWEGIRVFDISDPAAPRYVAAVETDCGSHTHTLAPTKDGRDLYVYVSSYSPNAAFPDCQPPHDFISVVKIPVASPDDASLVGTPVLFPDGGNPGGNGSSTTSGCHDITAYPAKDIAAGACMGDGILLDISDREHPVVIEQVRDTTNFAFWHSATFNNTGTKVVFTDELGGGGSADLQPDRRAEPRRRRDLRHRRRAAGVPQLLQDAADPVQHRELRGPQRLADPGEGQGHHGPGVVPGRDLGLGLHRLRAPRRRSAGSSAARSRTTGWSSAAPGRRTTTTATSTPTTSRRGSTCSTCVTPAPHRRSRCGWTSSTRSPSRRTTAERSPDTEGPRSDPGAFVRCRTLGSEMTRPTQPGVKRTGPDGRWSARWPAPTVTPTV